MDLTRHPGPSDTSLMEPPDTLYALSDGLHIAYQRFGSGPDVVIIPPLVSNVDLSRITRSTGGCSSSTRST